MGQSVISQFNRSVNWLIRFSHDEWCPKCGRNVSRSRYEEAKLSQLSQLSVLDKVNDVGGLVVVN